ncbi:hypothetical protein [Chryseobacterium sp. ISL-6]|uniref:hypothetical protein n=1 Tax=Chryseobacterium sp. ISL-6 TaxID=2819143 RepID=UPI001BEA032A|nr:hypothetical protein [Chryseobacterium sp. ISL-6]MBT2621283.1 hypothetical protein [Chryseobacterium sp. ISL-6]
MINNKNRLQWHKNSLIERSGYVLFYMNSLRDHLPIEDRQTLYMISKYFTDAVEFARTNIHAAKYFFEVGEHYQSEIPKDKILLNKLIFNSYDRAKSYYYFKIKNYDKANERINNTLEINKSLKEKFPILVFDSISHYQNLLKVLVFQNKKEEANTIIYELVKFLLTGNTELRTLENSFHVIGEDVFHDFKQFFLNEFIFNYMFLNSDFNDALNNLLTLYENHKELFKNGPIFDFLEVYQSDTINENMLEFFKEKYDNYFSGIPLKILQEKL